MKNNNQLCALNICKPSVLNSTGNYGRFDVNNSLYIPDVDLI